MKLVSYLVIVLIKTQNNYLGVAATTAVFHNVISITCPIPVEIGCTIASFSFRML
jgi:hypothetical protein